MDIKFVDVPEARQEAFTRGIGRADTSEAAMVEALAHDVHEAGRAAVEQGATLAQQVEVAGQTYTRRFVEWAELPEHAREGRRIQARYLLARYDLVPRE